MSATPVYSNYHVAAPDECTFTLTRVGGLYDLCAEVGVAFDYTASYDGDVLSPLATQFALGFKLQN